MIAEIRSDGAEPGRNSRRHDAAPDSRPGSFFILAFPSRRQAEPAPDSRRHDAAPDSRIGFVRAPTACLAVPGVCLLRGGRSAPPTPGAFMGLVAPAPTSGPARPTPGVPFVSRRKEPKACRGCAPGPPEWGHVVPPAALPHPLDRVSSTNPDRFATLS